MLKALHYCHNVVNLIHRDIKPDNIMINHNNEAILIDFGVSGLLEDKQEDVTKQTIGTYCYYPPEMFKAKADKKIDSKVDIWALGVTMFYLLTGSHLFEGIKEEDKLRKQICEIPVNLDCIRNPDTKEILSKML